jgi:hypothetical protein
LTSVAPKKWKRVRSWRWQTGRLADWAAPEEKSDKMEEKEKKMHKFSI